MAVAMSHSYNLRPKKNEGRTSNSPYRRSRVREKVATTPFSSSTHKTTLPESDVFQQTPLLEPKLPLKLKWKRCSDMPIQMDYNPSAVVMKGDVYFGGGLSPVAEDARTICVYHPLSDSWSRLPLYEHQDFRLAVLKLDDEERLVAIGGEDPKSETKAVTNKLGVWNDKQHQWVLSELPPMNTACSSPAVATYNQWLLVAGGYGEQYSLLSRVEVMNVVLKEWYQVSPLPVAWNRMTSTMVGNVWYLMGGWAKFKPRNFAMSICVEDIISETRTESTGAGTKHSSKRQLSKWNTLPDTPSILSTALTFNSSLLAIGGGLNDSNLSSEMHLYQRSTSKWIKVGDMPTRRSMPACTVLLDGDIILATGSRVIGENRVDRVAIST